MIFAMAIPNIIALYLLMPVVKAEMNRYLGRPEIRRHPQVRINARQRRDQGAGNRPPFHSPVVRADDLCQTAPVRAGEPDAKAPPSSIPECGLPFALLVTCFAPGGSRRT